MRSMKAALAGAMGFPSASVGTAEGEPDFGGRWLGVGVSEVDSDFPVFNCGDDADSREC